MALPQIRQDETYTVADYLSWDDGERWELIDGHPTLMSPAPATDHQRVAFALARQIADFLDAEETSCESLISPVDVYLPQAEEALEDSKTVVQPDVVVVCDPQKIESKGIVGAPDWLIEILSPSTSARDQGVKRDLYERHGVQEYWLVHPTDGVVSIYRLDDGRFAKPPEVSATEGTSSPALFPALEIDWERVFERVSPRG